MATATGALTKKSSRRRSEQDKKYIVVEAGKIAIVVVNDSSIVSKARQGKTDPWQC